MELERLEPELFERFCEFIYKKCGIRIDEKKVTLLSNRIRRRLKASEFETFSDYYRFLTSPAGVAELESFLDVITTNETFFFRTEKHFDWLKTELLTEMIAQHRGGLRAPTLRIWSAGCASGAEPYSIAICLAENAYRLRDWSLTILGTDISETMLRAARQGAFSPRAVEAVTPMQRRRYFQHRPDTDLWQIRPEIKKLVEFQRHNLIEPLPQPPCDCIFIRNVLIYFDRDSKQVAIRNILSSLAVGGYLVVGPSEGIHDMLVSLRKISPLLYQKGDDARPHGSVGSRGEPQR